MRVVTKIWVGLTLLVAGYVATVVSNDLIAHRLTVFFGQVDESQVPAVNLAQEAVIGFNQMMVECENGVVTGDREALNRGLAAGDDTVGVLRQITMLKSLASVRRETSTRVAGRIAAYRDDAAVVFKAMLVTTQKPDLMQRAADLANRAQAIRRDLAALTHDVRQDLRTAIEEQQSSVALNRQISDLVLVTILVAVVSGAVALTMHWSGRLGRLLAVSNRLTQGDYETSVTVAGADEIGRLGTQFERVRRAISERDLSLRVFNDTLEQQIRDRTRELESRNRELSDEIGIRHRAEQNLQFANQEAESMLGSLGSALIGLDGDDRVARWNSAAERLFGQPAEAMIGRTLAETGIRCDWAEIFLAITQCTTGKGTVEIPALRYEGAGQEERWLSLLVSLSRTQEGSRPGRGRVILLATDITERRREEAQRSQSAKLESIGQLSAGIAHEINTPIQFIGDNLRFLADAHIAYKTLRDGQARAWAELNPAARPEAISAWDQLVAACDAEYLDAEVPKAIEQALEGVTRVAGIVQAMKAFAHPDQGEQTRLDLNSAVQTTIAVARSEYKYVADIVTDLDPALPSIVCHASVIHQVLLNLVVNAAHAIAEKQAEDGARGTITITTRCAEQQAMISVADTGVGIPEAIQPKIFTPFFTTKGVGKGTGQGLHMAYTAVVQQHGGQIRFTTAAGRGTTFTIHLPLGGRPA